MKQALPLTVLLVLAVGAGCTANGRGLPDGAAAAGGAISASGGVPSRDGRLGSGGALGDTSVLATEVGPGSEDAPAAAGGSVADVAAGAAGEPASGPAGSEAGSRTDEGPDGDGISGTDGAAGADDARDGGAAADVVLGSSDDAQDRGFATDGGAGVDSGSDSGADVGRDSGLGANDGALNDGRPASDTRVDSGPIWRPLWSDEFSLAANAGADPAKWTPATSDPGTVNNEKQKYTARPQNIFHDGNGHLVLRGRHDFWNNNGTTYPYTSGRLQTDGRFPLKFGRIEVSAKLPAGQGSFPAILLMGTTGTWPQSGEIGLMEQWGQDKSWLYCSTYAGGASGDIGNQKISFPNATTLSSDFHLYALEWYPDHMVFFIDDVQVARSNFDTTSPFYTGTFYLILDVAIGGNMGGAIDDAGGFPMDMVLDYVRVFQQ